LSYSRETGEPSVRLDGLAFANGVAMAAGDEQGIFWVGIAGIRSPAFENLADKPFLLGLDGEGNVLYKLQDPNSEFSTTTGTIRNGDRLYICSLDTDAVGVLDLR